MMKQLKYIGKEIMGRRCERERNEKEMLIQNTSFTDCNYFTKGETTVLWWSGCFKSQQRHKRATKCSDSYISDNSVSEYCLGCTVINLNRKWSSYFISTLR